MIYTQALAIVGYVVVREGIAAIKMYSGPQRVDRVSCIKPDPAVLARIKAYTSLTMVERYGEYGPP